MTAGGGVLGVVLCGGESRRFGVPKALAKLHGRPLWRIAAESLAPLCREVVAIVNDPAVAREVALESRPDLRPASGPLAGIETGLAWGLEKGLSHALVLGCDMPWVESGLLALLLEEPAGEVPVVPRSDSRWGFDPLCGLYPVSALGALGGALADGRLEVGALVRSLGPVVTDDVPGAPWALRSVNTPRDLPPPAVSVIGNKKSGKTTLSVALVRELHDRGRRVMSAKHGHHFQLDREGTDSWRHRHEGRADRVLLAGPDEMAVMGGWGSAGEPPIDVLLAAYLSDAEIVVLEGFRHASRIPKVEIFRAAAQPEPILSPPEAAAGGALAVVTDRPDLPWSVPVFDPDAKDLAARLAELVEGALL